MVSRYAETYAAWQRDPLNFWAEAAKGGLNQNCRNCATRCELTFAACPSIDLRRLSTSCRTSGARSEEVRERVRGLS